MKKLILALLLVLFCSPAWAATYYIDYGATDDTANGTSTSTPWKRAPGMVGCADSCAAYSHSAGDKFVFKGGVTWPDAALPLTIANSGSSGSADVYTGGQLEGTPWGTGYPVFDGEDGGDFTGGLISLGTKSYVTINGIKIIRAGNTTDGSGTAILSGGGSGITISNNWLETNSINAFAFSCSSGTYSALYIHHNTIKEAGRIHITVGNARVTDVKYYNNVHYGAVDYDPFSFHTDGLMIGGDGDTDYAIQNLHIYNNKWTGDWTQGATAQLYLNGTTMTCYDYTDGSHEPTVNQVIYGETSGGIGNKVYTVTNTGGWTGSGTGTLCMAFDTTINGEHLHEGEGGAGNLVAIVSSAGTASTLKSTKTVYIHNNLFVTENASGSVLSPASIDITSGHDTIYIYNNTIDARSNLTESHCLFISSFVDNVDIKNNIFAGCDNGITRASTTSGATMTADYNLFYTAGSNHLFYDVKNSNRYNDCTTLAAFGWGTNYCAIADPKFITLPSGGTVGSGNWGIQADSPARSNGTDLGSPYTTDILGVVGTGRIGAYEYGEGAPATTYLKGWKLQ